VLFLRIVYPEILSSAALLLLRGCSIETSNFDVNQKRGTYFIGLCFFVYFNQTATACIKTDDVRIPAEDFFSVHPPAGFPN
jgi:hypothetical protein